MLLRNFAEVEKKVSEGNFRGDSPLDRWPGRHLGLTEQADRTNPFSLDQVKIGLRYIAGFKPHDHYKTWTCT